MKGCVFCEIGSPLLPGYHQVGVYHVYDVRLLGYPKCAHTFHNAKAKHPFVPSVGKVDCDFCGQLEHQKIHKD